MGVFIYIVWFNVRIKVTAFSFLEKRKKKRVGRCVLKSYNPNMPVGHDICGKVL